MAKKAELDLLDVPGGDTGSEGFGEPERIAAAATEAEPEQQPPPPGDGKRVSPFYRKMLVLPVMLLLLLSLSFFLFKHFREPGAPLQEEASGPLGESAVSAGVSPWITFRDLIIPVMESEDQTRLLFVDVAVEVEPAGAEEENTWVRDRRSDLYRVIQGKPLPVPVSAAFRKTLKETIHRSLAPHFGSGKIKGIYFTRFYYI